MLVMRVTLLTVTYITEVLKNGFKINDQFLKILTLEIFAAVYIFWQLNSNLVFFPIYILYSLFIFDYLISSFLEPKLENE